MMTTTQPPTTQISYLYQFKSHKFTSAGYSGSMGPKLNDILNEYSKELAKEWIKNSDFLNMKSQGIQEWKVPATGNYTIQAVGAGVPYHPNFVYYGMNEYQKGIDVKITTILRQGEIIKILVGQKPDEAWQQTSGAGGTFVVRDTQTPILIAGGGGGRGAYICRGSSNATSSNSGQDGSDGISSLAYIYGKGGTNGNGGGSGIGSKKASYSGGGGGLYSNGTNSTSGFGDGGFAFINGGGGGGGLARQGGFGGGAGAGGVTSGGGGGGFSGGGNGGQDDTTAAWSSGGGGGSYSITGSFDSAVANNNDNGNVVITANF